MYLTVQKVYAPHRGRGINGAVYVHGATRDQASWNPPNLRPIVEHNVGQRVAERVDLSPGGNAVETFLDVAGPDDVNLQELKEALSSFREELRHSRQESQFGALAMEFCANLGAEPVRAFDELRDAAIDLFQKPRLTNRPTPLTIEMSHDDTGWQYRLAQQDVKRLMGAFEGVQIAQVSIPYDTADDFRKTYGELHPHVVEWVTSKRRSDLLPLGGVEIVERGQTVWKWPR